MVWILLGETFFVTAYCKERSLLPIDCYCKRKHSPIDCYYHVERNHPPIGKQRNHPLSDCSRRLAVGPRFREALPLSSCFDLKEDFERRDRAQDGSTYNQAYIHAIENPEVGTGSVVVVAAEKIRIGSVMVAAEEVGTSSVCILEVGTSSVAVVAAEKVRTGSVYILEVGTSSVAVAAAEKVRAGSVMVAAEEVGVVSTQVLAFELFEPLVLFSENWEPVFDAFVVFLPLLALLFPISMETGP
jgi:hypothetical protein